MANRITQYQSKAEVRPLAGSFKERTTPDKYQGVEYLPFGNALAKAGALAVLAVTTAFAFVPVVTAPAPAVSTWHPAIEQPRFEKPRTQYLAPSYAAPERQPQPRVDSWFQPASEPVRVVRNQYLAPSYFGPEQQPQPRLDSWFQLASEPVRLPDRHIVSLGDSELQLTTAQHPERVSADKWLPLSNQPQFDKRRAQYTYEWSAYDPQPFPDRVYADRWWQQPNQPQFDQRHNQYLYPSYFGPDQQPKPRFDSWWQQASEPVRLPDRRIQAQGFSVLGVPPAEDVEEISPDRWQPLSNQPQFDVKRNQYLYPASFAPDRQPQPRLDSWFQPASEPVRLRDSRIQRLGASELDLTPTQDVERTSVDKYDPGTQQPFFDKKRTQHSYEFSFFNPQPFPSPVFADKWLPLSNQPQFDVARRQHLYPSAFAPDRQPEPRLDSWWQRTAEPIFPRDRRVQVLGDSELTLAPAQEPERSTPDKWHPATEQPVVRHVSRAHLFENAGVPFTPASAPVVLVSSWYQQPSEPTRVAPSRRHVYQSYFAPERQPTVSLDWLTQASEPARKGRHVLQTDGGFVAVLESVTVDKWYQQANQPRFDVRRTQYVAPSFFAPDRQPVPSVDSWWQLGNQPLFDVRREQYAYPTLFTADRQPDVRIDAWWQLGNQPLFDVQRQQWLYQSYFRPDAAPLLLPGDVSVEVKGNSIKLAFSTCVIDTEILSPQIAIELLAITTVVMPSAGSVTVTVAPLG